MGKLLSEKDLSAPSEVNNLNNLLHEGKHHGLVFKNIYGPEHYLIVGNAAVVLVAQLTPTLMVAQPPFLADRNIYVTPARADVVVSVEGPNLMYVQPGALQGPGVIMHSLNDEYIDIGTAAARSPDAVFYDPSSRKLYTGYSSDDGIMIELTPSPDGDHHIAIVALYEFDDSNVPQVLLSSACVQFHLIDYL